MGWVLSAIFASVGNALKSLDCCHLLSAMRLHLKRQKEKREHHQPQNNGQPERGHWRWRWALSVVLRSPLGREPNETAINEPQLYLFANNWTLSETIYLYLQQEHNGAEPTMLHSSNTPGLKTMQKDTAATQMECAARCQGMGSG